MKTPRWLVVLSLSFPLAMVSALSAAEPSATAAGHWEGGVTLPNAELVVRVDLSPGTGQTWQGTIDMPLHGMRGFKLDSIKVDGGSVAFALPGIPGDPRFSGTMAADAKSIAGDFTQGEHTFPFKLERKPAPPPMAVEDETPAKGVPGKGLAAVWRASLKPLPNIELRLVLELTPAGTGKVEGVLVSLDQNKARIPINALTEADGVVHFETASVGGIFDGKLNADGSELAGNWTQAGHTTPLAFKRTAKPSP